MSGPFNIYVHPASSTSRRYTVTAIDDGGGMIIAEEVPHSVAVLEALIFQASCIERCRLLIDLNGTGGVMTSNQTPLEIPH